MYDVQDQSIVEQSDAAGIANKPLLKMLQRDVRIRGNKRVSCATCNKQFSSKNNLKEHERTHTDTLFSCRTCGKKYKYKQNLKIHERIHTSVKLLQYQQCKAQFSKHSHLKRHECNHTDTLYSCKACGKKYKYK